MPKKPSLLDRTEELLNEGELPHEFLLRIARGGPVIHKSWKIKHFKQGPRAGEFKSKELIEEEIYPTFSERMEAAKIAAPYFTPKLASSTVKQEQTVVEFTDDFSGGGSGS